MELNICEGDYGLASLDPECLQILLLGKVTKAPLSTTSKQSTKYPIFKHENKRMERFPEVQNYLEKLGYTSDGRLNMKQQNEAYALKTMVQVNLGPVLKYLWWINECNYENFTTRWFMSSIKFPFNFAGIRRLKNEALSFLQLQFPNETLETIKNILIKKFKDCFPLFVNRLSKSSFYFGDEISSLDIILYGYLAPIIKIPFPQNEFKDAIENYSLFYNFISKINRNFFPEISYTEKYFQVTRTNEEMELNHPKIVFFFGLIVTVTIFGVGLSRALGKENI